MILAIDSSLGTSVAVVDPASERVLARAENAATRGHAEVIGTLIASAMTGAGIAPRDVTSVAAGMGPGPFTGLRIGIAAARAFAVGRGVPVVPVISHDAVALERLEKRAADEAEAGYPMIPEDGDPTFGVCTDARRREFAATLYTVLDDDGLPVRTGGPELQPFGEPNEDGYVPTPTLVTRIDAGSLGRLAARMIAADRVPDMSEPLYLRAPDAKVPGAVKRVST